MEFLYDIATGAYSLDALIRCGLYDLATGRYSPEALRALIQCGGSTALVAIVFTETGLLVGVFLPGDSLLIIAGVMAAAGVLNIWWVDVSLIVAAVVGDSTGYAIGMRAGPRLFTRPKSLVFNPRHVERTRRFYERYGAKTIVIARFVPIIRTFAPVLAGVGQMRYRRFFFYNVAGGVGWVLGMTWAGYLLGNAVPNIDRHLPWVALIVIVLSCVPIAIEILRERRKRSASSVS